MSGFDTPAAQHGIFAQTKQFGSLLRGNGPPVPQMGVTGDLYVDEQTWQLFNKRALDNISPWGHYLFTVPLTYRATLKWFSAARPSNSVGVDGDYCLIWGAYPNYGMQPSILGPKAAGVWPANAIAVAVGINSLYGAEDVVETTPSSNLPVSITTSTYVISSPGIYYVNYPGTVDITLSPSATFSRGEIIVKDVSGNAHTNVINLHADASDTNRIDGLEPYPINTDFGALTLYPATLGFVVI